MKIRVAFVAAAMALSGALSGCSTIGLGGGRTPASASGGAATPAAPETIISAMDGGLIGGSLGSAISESDRRTALQAEYRALEYSQAGNTVDWTGSKGSGSVIAAQPYRVGSQDCRQYTHTVAVGGQKQSARGTACRNPDGSWTPLT
jgi:surface antigen